MTVPRLERFTIGENSFETPAFFASISSVKTALAPSDYLSVCQSLLGLYDNLLISAFDFSRAEKTEELAKKLGDMKKAGATILMDSGNYESYWKEEQDSWRQENFHSALGEFTCDFAFAFDEQKPPAEVDEHVKLVVANWEKDKEASDGRLIVPIVHGKTEDLPDVCLKIVKQTELPMIGVPERRLGDGLFQRVEMVKKIRQSLDKSGQQVGLHLLGTGNPTSIALYSWAGADSFDGLEWCQTVVDHDSGFLFHLSQYDFFIRQTDFGDADDLSFHAQVLVHNLQYYANWMPLVRSALHSDTIKDLLLYNLPGRMYGQLLNQLFLKGGK